MAFGRDGMIAWLLESAGSLEAIAAEMRRAARAIGGAAPSGGDQGQPPADQSARDHYTYTGDSNCRSCGTAILWFKTPAGKNLPVDDCRAAFPRLLERGDHVSIEEARDHLLKNSHFETCPEASKHRRSR
uniref:Uncharacterized protein n=1 Tax=viral metagenome TaxID=1070528 RepID=A0A6M3IKU4_9ZZZZ